MKRSTFSAWEPAENLSSSGRRKLSRRWRGAHCGTRVSEYSLLSGLFENRKRKSSVVSENSENDLPAPSDSELLDQIQQGDDCAATALYKRYADRLLRLAQVQTGAGLAKRIEAEDVVQSVFRTFFRRAATGHYALPDGDELWKLFLVIALNKIRKKSEFHRAAKRDVDRTQSIGDSQISSDDEASHILKMTVEELIAELPPSHRGVIHDRIQGFEVSDLAERNQLSRRTVERILQNFRDRMRKELQEYADL